MNYYRENIDRNAWCIQILLITFLKLEYSEIIKYIIIVLLIFTKNINN